MGNIMVKCNTENCTSNADIEHSAEYYCATCYMNKFMKAKLTKRLKRRIEGQLRHKKLAVKKT